MSQPVRLRGTLYPSIEAAARAFGCSTKTIGRALDRGLADSFEKPVVRKEITIRGVTYPSHGAAAKAIGVSRNCISIAAREGWLAGVGLTKAARQ